ncbi:Succinyl-diaminopimelate desuccinylase [Candidatus Arsenophonus lipoptenae]|uniref:Succinyl-diaminopimelate desuccinylase n=1 Tax=Candidatus Arsenophonus lipoptenae TaxID=634113 RepID=A0A109Q7K7_9GAMM|nr:succinyl-diaminopimelate desuccinylase [Candidatus Arsenophonus lipoptenae]AMA65129.1 Succinyl-diaminopimelate desuccinylase [Candidatus Arsenophonus lipoptenae]
MICPVIKLAQELIQQPSISPNDHGCQIILMNRLKKIGFLIEVMSFGDTTNLWAYHGKYGDMVAFAGHTDVVPAGKIQDWRYPPFTPTVDKGMLYGRGAADMKGSLAAMIIATEKFIIDNPNHAGRLGFLITSDEESEAINGTAKVIDKLIYRKEKINYCIIGEPSSHMKLGDNIKNGRRGSLTAKLDIKGTQSHIAYPCLTNNLIHNSLSLLNELIKKKWDTGNDFFPPTSMQIFNINTNSISNNTIPGELSVQFNFRFNSNITEQQIRHQVEKILRKYNFHYKIKWVLSGNPFITKSGKLIDIVRQVIKQHCGYQPQLSTSGGTSDGRFITKMGTEIVELGLSNQTIHKVNECVSIIDLQNLSFIYQNILQKIFAII